MTACFYTQTYGGGVQEYKRMNQYQVYKEVKQDKTGKYQLLCANCNWIKRYEKNEVSKGRRTK